MVNNYFKLSVRSLAKNKLFTAIKLTGLSIGMTGCLLIGLYLHHELSFDAFHEKADRIVRVTMEYRFEEKTRQVAVTGNKVVPSFRRDFPEVESGVRINPLTMNVRQGERLFEEKDFFFADSTFFEIFSFPLLQGHVTSALNTPNKVVLTQKMARKYFGDTDPLGKTIQVGTSGDYVVSGVMADPPANSQLQPNFVASIISLRDMSPERSTWWNANYGAYLLLKDANSWQALQAKIPGYMRRFTSEHNAEGNNYLTYNLEPLRRVHLHSEVASIFEPNGDIRYLYILGAVGLFILLIAGITYVNLSTAVSTERAREVGIQKVLGAGRRQLFTQHLSEALLLSGFAILLGYALAAPLLPLFNNLIGRPLQYSQLVQPFAVTGVLGFGVVVGLLSGLYPAAVLSGFQPVKVLKGQFKFTGSGAWLRKSLIVVQFGISVFLIISTLALQGQLHFIQNKKLGLEREHVVALSVDGKIVEQIDAVKAELLKNPLVKSASLAYETPIHIKGGYGIDKSPAGGAWSSVLALPTDQDFVPTMNIELAAGANLSKQDVELAHRQNQRIDTALTLPILINEKQAKLFNWTPEEAVAKLVNFNGRLSLIKGVMKDFHFASLHEPIENLVVFPDNWGQTLLIKTSGSQPAASLQYLENAWKTLAPHRPFAYHFLDEEFDQLYESETQTGRLITAFSGLAIFLACLGLFGLASYTIVQRTKEIGIRKVLGASVPGLIGLMSGEFILLVLAALLIAAPAAWLVMQDWLEDFAYHTELSWWMVALAGLTAVGIAFLTVSIQSIKAAFANPVQALRSE